MSQVYSVNSSGAINKTVGNKVSNPVKDNTKNNPTTKKNGDERLKKALIGLGVIAAAGIGLYAAHKTGKLSKVEEKVKNVVGKFTPKKELPLFDKNNIVEGIYRDSSGNKIIVDKCGTGIVDMGHGVFQVMTSGGATKIYDVNNIPKNAMTTELSTIVEGIKDNTAKAAKQIQTSKQYPKLPEKNLVSGNKSTDIVSILDSRLKNAENLLTKYKQNPTEKNYRNLVKITHPDCNVNAPEEISTQLSNIMKEATQLKQAAA